MCSKYSFVHKYRKSARRQLAAHSEFYVIFFSFWAKIGLWVPKLKGTQGPSRISCFCRRQLKNMMLLFKDRERRWTAMLVL